MQETQKTQVLSLGWEDPLEKKWQPAPVFCLETCMVEEPGELPSMGLQGVGHNWATEHTHMAYTNQPVL